MFLGKLFKNRIVVLEETEFSFGLRLFAGDLGPIPGSEDPLEKRRATHSIIFAWRTPWTEEPGRLQSLGLQRVRHT